MTLVTVYSVEIICDVTVTLGHPLLRRYISMCAALTQSPRVHPLGELKIDFPERGPFLRGPTKKKIAPTSKLSTSRPISRRITRKLTTRKKIKPKGNPLIKRRRSSYMEQIKTKPRKCKHKCCRSIDTYRALLLLLWYHNMIVLFG